jgi:cyclopropane fatty-acyl-phospholipid synthase-like methyltransferase
MSLLSRIVRRLSRLVRRPRSPLEYRGDHLAEYARHTDRRVELDPKAAIGGMWDEIGQLQIDFLKNEGLLPEHRLLDIGCGTLRGGRHFIGYLDAGRYTGTELSAKAVEAARSLIEREELTGKGATIIHVADGRLTFEGLSGPYTYIFAQSVFTHLAERHIEQCFANLPNIMDDRSLFYFTFNDATEPTRSSFKNFAYPFGFLSAIAEAHGLTVEDFSERYPHPGGQRMAQARLARDSHKPG